MIAVRKVLLYYHTLRYLRFTQVAARVWSRIYRPKPSLDAVPRLRTIQGNWQSGANRNRSLHGPDTFCFLNELHTIDSAGDWNNPGWQKLWLYHLHYFDDLNAESFEKRSEWNGRLIARWIRENPPTVGIGWEPYPLSRRIVNWIKWALADQDLPRDFVHSIGVQTRALVRRLEFHLLGNHLFSNAKALVFAGLFFDGQEADRWMNTGISILEHELPVQILADGGHFERSPMYHSIVLEDLLDLVNVFSTYDRTCPPDWPDAVQRMRHWLSVMVHTDGEIGFFNDAALGIAPSPAALEEYAVRLGFTPGAAVEGNIAQLRESGYVRMQRGLGLVLLDAAPVGPDHLPGHAHADTLSFEMSLYGHRIVVNSGTSMYTDSAERRRQRGTPAHSTVTVNGKDSSEVWGVFRVARRAKPFDLRIDNAAARVECAHDGYRRLAGHPIHRRAWEMGDTTLRIVDVIEDKGRINGAVARFHIHPAVGVVQGPAANEGKLQLAEGKSLKWRIEGGTSRIANGTYHPEFGTSIPNQCIEIQFDSSLCTMDFIWT